MNRTATTAFFSAGAVVTALLALTVVDLPAQTTAAATAPAGQRVFYASHSLMWDMPPVLTELVTA